ncbi:MAG: TIR domain-containing protein [Pyrinomonadaceae bacterium]
MPHEETPGGNGHDEHAPGGNAPHEDKGGGLKRVLGWPSKFLFGDDIFISYARADGATYAAGLADRLAARNFSCRFDQWGTEPGREMPDSLKGALRRSALLVLVGSEGAARSAQVALEVAEMKRRRGRIIPVAFDGVQGAFAGALWAGDIEGLPVSRERGGALRTGEPSAEVLSRVEKTFTFSRKDERLRRATTFAAVLLLLLVGANIVAGYVATQKGREASRKTDEAVLAEGRARAAEHRAKEQEENARLQTARAEEAAAKAARAEQLAGEKTKLAADKSRLAAEKTLLADAQTRRAEAAGRLAAAQELSARRNLARSFDAQAQAEVATDPLRALAWAESAARTAPAGDENLSLYVLRAVNLAARAPLAVIDSPASLRQATFSPQGDMVVTVSESGRFAVLDTSTGESLPHPYSDTAADYYLYMDYPFEPAFSPDGRLIALVAWERARPGERGAPHLRVWESRTGVSVQDIRLEGWRAADDIQGSMQFAKGKGPAAVVFSPGGEEIIVFTDARDGMFVWDVASGARREYDKPTREPEWGGVRRDLSLSRDPARNWFLETARGVRVATAAGGAVETDVLRVREVKTGTVVKELALVSLERHLPEHVSFAAFTPDARKVVVTSASGGDGWLRVWDIASGRVNGPANLNDAGGSAGMSRDMRDPRAISPDGKSVLLTVWNSGHPRETRAVEVWDIGGEAPGVSSRHIFSQLWASDRTLSPHSSFYSDDGEYVIDVAWEYVERHDTLEEVSVWSVRSNRLVSQPLRISGGARLSHVSTRDKTASVIYKDGRVLTWNLVRDGAWKRSTARIKRPESLFSAEVTAMTSDLGAVLILEQEPNAPFKKTLRLWDASTGAPLWPDDVKEFTEHSTKLSPDGTRLVVLREPVKPTPGEAAGLVVLRTSDGRREPGFHPIPTARRDTAVEFSRDGAALLTGEPDGQRGATIRLWSATTGEPLSGPGRVLSGAEGEFLGFTRFGEFCMVVPPVLTANYTEMTLLRIDERLTPLVRLRFADHGTAALAAALFRQARQIRTGGPGGVVATLDSGVDIYVTAAPAGAALTNGRTGRQLLPPLDFAVNMSMLMLSPDGRLVAACYSHDQKSLARVWDAATGLPLTERLWHENAVSSYAFSPDGARLMTATQTGVLRTWFVGDMRGAVPVWVGRASEALAGLRVVGGADVQRVTPGENARARREFAEALNAAAISGDEGARFLLGSQRR